MRLSRKPERRRRASALSSRMSFLPIAVLTITYSFLFHSFHNLLVLYVTDENSSPSPIVGEESLLSNIETMATSIEHTTHAQVDDVTFSLARAFTKYPRPLPCLAPTNKTLHSYRKYTYGFENKRDTIGMFYTKLSKCSSSTLAGIAVKIARNEAKRRRRQSGENIPDECLVKADHGSYRNVVSQRDKQRSLLWTFIRHPVRRQVSDFFHFHVSRRGVDPNNITAFQEESSKALRIVDYMTGSYFHVYKRNQNFTSSQKVDFILHAYDFIGTVDRYHESLVLLKIIYGLELRDILYTSAKRSGGYDDGEYRGKCTYIQKSYVSPEMKTWFETSPEWRERVKDDMVLYNAVDRSIDLTIDAFGHDKVERQVKVLERALDYADLVCGATAIYPCSADGKLRSRNETTCVAHDWACAHKCIETLDLSEFE